MPFRSGCVAESQSVSSSSSSSSSFPRHALSPITHSRLRTLKWQTMEIRGQERVVAKRHSSESKGSASVPTGKAGGVAVGRGGGWGGGNNPGLLLGKEIVVHGPNSKSSASIFGNVGYVTAHARSSVCGRPPLNSHPAPQGLSSHQPLGLTPCLGLQALVDVVKMPSNLRLMCS